MYISRIVIKNFKNLKDLDLLLDNSINCVVGENNTGKSNFLYAIRLAIDANLPYYCRSLSEDDFSEGIDISSASQIMIGLQLTDFYADDEETKIKEHALAQEWEIEKNLAQVCYRFRPNKSTRQKLLDKELKDGELSIEDYGWEVMVGPAVGNDGNVKDLKDITWEDEFSSNIKFNRLIAYRIAFLHPIRNVEDDLRSQWKSPLHKLLKISDMTDEKKDELVQKIKRVNKEISSEEDIKQIAQDINASFEETVGSIFKMETSIGMVPPSFRDIAKSLTILLSGDGLDASDVSRNGLDLNNVLYISMLLVFFNKQILKNDTAGELMLIEEPEAHLHPQLQRVLFSRLKDRNCQIIVTSHSTHITSNAPLNKLLIFTRESNHFISVKNPGHEDRLRQPEKDDLERYLDATKSTLLFAKKVMLVEGMAEVFLIRVLIKKIKDIDIEEHGISVIPIHGVHFGSYLKLFGEKDIRKKCAVLTDGDLIPSDASEGKKQDFPRIKDLKECENDFVKVFNCKTTFEREVATPNNCKMLGKVAEELGASQISKTLNEYYTNKKKLTPVEIEEIKQKVLNTAKRFGKARFAQVAARYVNLAEDMPDYIGEAIGWMLDETDQRTEGSSKS